MAKSAKRIGSHLSESMQRDLVEQSGLMVADPPLVDIERMLIENLVVKGSHAFDDLGYTADKVGAFLSRPSVKREIERLQATMSDAEGMVSRQQFMARVKLGQMIPAALAIVQRRLRGTQPDAKGNVPKASSMPTSEQYSAALEVLDRAGISASTQINISHLEMRPSLDPRMTEAEEDGESTKYDTRAIMRRERVRNAVAGILRTMGAVDAKVSSLTDARSLRTRLRTIKKAQKEARGQD